MNATFYRTNGEALVLEGTPVELAEFFRNYDMPGVAPPPEPTLSELIEAFQKRPLEQRIAKIEVGDVPPGSESLTWASLAELAQRGADFTPPQAPYFTPKRSG